MNTVFKFFSIGLNCEHLDTKLPQKSLQVHYEECLLSPALQPVKCSLEINIYMYMCMYMYVYVYIYVCVCVCVHIYKNATALNIHDRLSLSLCLVF